MCVCVVRTPKSSQMGVLFSISLLLTLQGQERLHLYDSQPRLSQTLTLSRKHICHRHFFTLCITVFICFAVNKTEKLSSFLPGSESSVLYF